MNLRTKAVLSPHKQR